MTLPLNSLELALISEALNVHCNEGVQTIHCNDAGVEVARSLLNRIDEVKIDDADVRFNAMELGMIRYLVAVHTKVGSHDISSNAGGARLARRLRALVDASIPSCFDLA